MKQKGFSLTELLVSMAVILIISGGMYSAYRYYRTSGIAATKKAINLNNMRAALDKLKHDLLISQGLYDNDYSKVYSGLSASFSGQTTGTSQLIVKVPSINSSGQFINLYDPEYTDYYHYYLSGEKLIRKTYKSTKSGSARSTDDYIMAEGLDSITFSDGLNLLGACSNEDLLSLRHLQITITALVKNTMDGSTHTETLILNVSFRNYL
ncbi:MAG: prepilin-type N-terminal cleavage/methylation domain-containing protein [Candidatus Aureabacteria bacterium]|nr:prepilin-type N-terminal cleavage/methylation domain-containing protein [Candidatus Auribacterota bacterium]